jgi:hypothetical protein
MNRPRDLGVDKRRCDDETGMQPGPVVAPTLSASLINFTVVGRVLGTLARYELLAV